MDDPGFPRSQDSWFEEAEPPDRRASRGKELLAWFGVIALVAVGSLAVDPAFSIPVGCLMCGWEEIRLARWLKRSDPVRTRGRVCSRFYLAWGLWKVVLVAMAMMFVIVFAQESKEGWPGKGGRETTPPPAFMGCGLTMLVGVLLASVVSCFAVASALRHRVRVWVGPEAHWALEDEVWPPQMARPRGKTTNRTKTILIGALIAAFTSGIMFVLLPVSLLITQNFKSPITLILVIVFAIFGVPVSILVLLDRLSARMIAPTPSICWSLDDQSDRGRA